MFIHVLCGGFFFIEIFNANDIDQRNRRIKYMLRLLLMVYLHLHAIRLRLIVVHKAD